MQDRATIGLLDGFRIHGIQGIASNLDAHDKQLM